MFSSPEEEAKVIIDLYGQVDSIKQIEKQTGLSWNKIVKTLSTAGIICNDKHRQILELHNSGVPSEEIAKALNMSLRTVESYLPRVRPTPGYCVSKNAQNIKKFRDKKVKREINSNRKKKKPMVDYSKYTDLSILTDREREIFQMRQSGMACYEIAVECDIKEQSVHMALNKALKKLDGRFDREAERAYHRNWRSHNRERIAVNYKRHVQSHREKINAYKRKYYHRNLERFRAYQKKWREKQKVKKLEETTVLNNFIPEQEVQTDKING